MLSSKIGLVAVLLGLAVAGGISALAARWAVRQKEPGAGPWWGALAVGLGYLVAHLGIATPAFPPGDVTDWIPLIALASAGVAWALSGARAALWARILWFMILARLVEWLILGPGLRASEFAEETIWFQAGIIGASAQFFLNISFLDAPDRRSELWVGLTVLAAGSSVVLILASSAVLFELGIVLTLVLAVSLLASWGRPVGGGVPVAAAVIAALMVEAEFYASMPAIPACLIAGAPSLLWLLRIKAIRRFGPKTRSLIAGALILIPVTVAIALAYQSYTPYGNGI